MFPLQQMRGVSLLEIQRPSLPNINIDKLASQTERRGKPAPSCNGQECPSQTERSEEDRTQWVNTFISMAGDAEGSKGIELLHTRLSFTVDKDTGETVVSIVDSETGEVIKKIPPDEILSLKKRIGEMIGLLLDEKA
jgi:uncharacterized FlaG/YvyC family protein